jgi:hypothetical protein
MLQHNESRPSKETQRNEPLGLGRNMGCTDVQVERRAQLSVLVAIGANARGINHEPRAAPLARHLRSPALESKDVDFRFRGVEFPTLPPFSWIQTSLRSRA